MSAFNFIKKILGFSDDEVLADDIDNDNVATEQSSPNEIIEPQPVSSAPQTPVIDPVMKSRIFAGVVAVFNEALPDFIQHSVNPELQQQRLVEALDKSCNDYLDSLIEQANRYAEARLKNAADVARNESVRLKEEMENVNRARNIMREQQLSAERRSRALNDRVRDLEEQVQKLEAEREQFQLENMSLMNKLKVAGIQPGIVDDLNREVEELRAQIAAGQQASSNLLNSDSPEVDALKARLDSLNVALTTAEREKEELRAANATLDNNLKEITSNFENASKRAEMQEAMYADLQKVLAETKTELEEAKAEAAQTTAKANAQLDEAREVVKNFAQLEKQFENVARVIQKRDEIIERLKNEKKELKDALKAKFSDPTDNLFSMTESGNESEEPTRTASESFEPLPEDDFQVPEWFVSEPAPVPKDNDTPFGYQEPQKKHRHPDNDAQMSLF